MQYLTFNGGDILTWDLCDANFPQVRIALGCNYNSHGLVLDNALSNFKEVSENGYKYFSLSHLC